MKELKRYISDDGKCEGTREEVEAYEASLNPLAKFKFPWHLGTGGAWLNKDNGFAVTNNAEQATELLNLTPLVEELRQSFEESFPDWRTSDFDWRMNRDTRALILAYEKALGIEVKS